MEANNYQNFCQSVRLKSANPLYAVLNLSGEVGELHSLMAKGIRDGAKDDHFTNIKKELGDILWSVAIVALDNNLTLHEVMQANVDKLSKRKEVGTLKGSGDDR